MPTPYIYSARISSPAAPGNDAFVTFASEGNPDVPGDEMENRIAALFFLLRADPTIYNASVMSATSLVEVSRRLVQPGAPSQTMAISTAKVDAILAAWELIDPLKVAGAPNNGASAYTGTIYGATYVAPMGSAILVREQSTGVKGRCFIPFPNWQTIDPANGQVQPEVVNLVERMFALFHRLPYDTSEPTGNHSGVYSKKNNAFYHTTAVSVSNRFAHLKSRAY